jgi:CRISPR-associated protein Cas5d
MTAGVRLRVWGDYALFSRPEFKAERVTYDVITPSAARGILECIHWRPAIRWNIDSIRVLRPIRFDSVRRNEVGKKLPYGTARQAARGSESDLVLFADEERQQRASLLLRNVAYIIDAHFELTQEAGPEENAGKHADMARRRIIRGQCVQQPYFGCREFPAFFEPVAPDAQFDPPMELLGRRDLGWMLHDIDFEKNAAPHFFRAELVDGVLAVPAVPFGACGFGPLK